MKKENELHVMVLVGTTILINMEILSLVVVVMEQEKIGIKFN